MSLSDLLRCPSELPEPDPTMIPCRCCLPKLHFGGHRCPVCGVTWNREDEVER